MVVPTTGTDMFVKFTKALLGMTIAMGAAVIALSPSFAGAEHAGWAETGAEVSVPYGWVDFCMRYRGECPTGVRSPRDIEYTSRAQRDIERINRWVNKTVESVSDKDHFGVVDRWDYPTDGKGDCEDYVLLKRRMLSDLGYPMQALLITVVKDKKGDGHAVLTMRTDRGDLVLDNLEDEVKGWKKTGYRFVKRQSQYDYNSWVSIGAPTAAPAYVSR